MLAASSHRQNQLGRDPWILLGPLALLGRLLEVPFLRLHRLLARFKHGLITWYCALMLTFAAPMPVRADFLGFDLIPLAGSLLVNIRDFYLRYQEQIILLKKLALAYYAVRQLDVDQLKRDLGELAELEATELARHWVNRKVTGFVHALTYSGTSQNTSGDLTPATHDGGLQRGLRFRVEDNEGQARYLTTSEVWNELFNPFDPNWDPALTQETYLVLKARRRWLFRELGRYRRAIQTWEKLASIYDLLYLEDIEKGSVQAAIRWAISSSLSLDRVAARLKSMRDGAIKHYISKRRAHWQARVAEVRLEQRALDHAIREMRADMGDMERRAMGMISARIKRKSLRHWNYVLPASLPPGAAPKSRLKALPHLHWSPFPKGWG